MKKYDYDFIRNVLNEVIKDDNVIEVSLGMKEDWFWTAQAIWTRAHGLERLDSFSDEDNTTIEDAVTDHTKIGGIVGSQWATPVICVEYAKGEKAWFYAYPAKRGRPAKTQPNPLEYGVLSKLIQERIENEPIKHFKL